MSTYEGNGKILRIFINENTRYENILLYEAIVKRAFELGLAGSMVFRGVEGFGFCCPSCRTRSEGMTISSCQPMVIEFIDTETKLNELIPVVRGMVKTGAIILQDADIILNRFE